MTGGKESSGPGTQLAFPGWGAPSREALRWERPGLRLALWPGWLHTTPLHVADLMEHLRRAIPWRQPEVTVYGRRHPVPRLTCWLGDAGCAYRYSGLVECPHPWTEPLSQVRDRLEAHLGVGFNCLLLNRYRDGRDRMGWHADDEPELVADHPIASLSLGASRTLRFRPRPGGAPAEGDPPEPLSVELADGDLLLMAAPTQRYWQHGLPSRLGVKSERFNLTFRAVQPGMEPQPQL
ncbi:MAG: alpha-ketoglutarate-dependent dioxygenase AlkB [Cyanobacteriota bacterium]|nr:alpha-ketoglutarate-dependent dioxygenase AlkB [Cyanobacteriota bacterium]